MSNIFKNRDESELVSDRKVRPVKGSPGGTQPAPTTPEPAPELPPAQSEVSTPMPSEQQPAPQQQPEPSVYQAPIPFAPPIGYDPVQSNPNAFAAQGEILNSIQESATQVGNSGLDTLLQTSGVVNPAIQSISELEGDPLSKAEEWTNEWTGSVKQTWQKHVTHTKVGINPATQFDASGKPIKQATEQEIRTGLNGVMSDLGRSLQGNFDKGNWFTGTVTGMKGLVPMVKSFFESVPGAVAAVPGMPAVVQGGLSLFNVPDNYLEQNRRNIEAHKALFYANVRGDMNAASDARKILQNNPLKQQYNDFGDGALGTAFRVLSIPENMTMAAVYEYADGWRQLMDNREKRTFLGNLQAGLGAAAGTLRGTEKEYRRDSNRWLQMAGGRDLSTFQRWSDEKYLTTQEPKDLEMGTMSGNWWWDVPENIMLIPDNLRRLSTAIATGNVPAPSEKKPWDSFGGYMTLAMLHNTLQGVPAFVGGIVVDAPFDAVVDGLWKLGKAKELTSIDVDDVPLMEVRRMDTKELPPGTRLALPAADGSTSAYMGGVTIDVPASTVIDPPMGTPMQPKQAFEVVADPWDFTPNPNKAQIHLQETAPMLLPSSEIDFVYRSNEQLSSLANRMGIQAEATPAHINELQRLDGDRFARYGKPISDEMPNFNVVATPDGTKLPINPVPPITPSRLTGEELIERMNNAASKRTDAEMIIQDALRQGEIPPESALVLYEKNQSVVRVTRDSIPPATAYVENVHKLPSALHTNHPAALNDGSQYIQGILDAEDATRAQRQLINNYNELDGVDQLVDTQLKALPNVGYEDMQDIQANLGHNGMDDMMDVAVAQDVPEPQQLINTVESDPIMVKLEQEVKDNADAWRTKSNMLEKKLTKEYKKQGLDPLDYDSDPEFALPQAEHLFKVQELQYKQMKRVSEITGAIDPMDADNFLVNKNIMLNEHLTILPKAKQQSMEFMYNDIQQMLDSKKAGNPDDPRIQQIWTEGQKPQAVPQEAVINQQIQTTPQAGDMTMTGGSELDDAWQQGNEAFSQMVDPISSAEDELVLFAPKLLAGEDVEYTKGIVESLIEAQVAQVGKNDEAAKASAESLMEFLTNPDVKKGFNDSDWVDLQWKKANTIVENLDTVNPFKDNFVDDTLQRFPNPGEAVESYTMNSAQFNVTGFDAALHRDLIIMGEKDWKNLQRVIPPLMSDEYVDMIKSGKIRQGVQLPRSRALSFTNMDAPGAQSFRSKFTVELVSDGTIQGADIKPISYYPNENEVLVPKFTKLEVTYVKEDAGKFTIGIKRVFDQPVATPEDYIKRQLQKGGDLVWMHGTNVDDDIRRFIPENGSGTHELGLGLYLTVDPRVAEAASVKFRYENTPVNLNYQVGEPHISEVDLTNIRTVINLDDMITKGRFNELFGGTLDNLHEPQDVQDFYKYWRDNSDLTVGSVFDTYRLWLADLNGGVDELLNRDFQRGVFEQFRNNYDAGIKGGTMVVYDPSRLTNKGIVPVIRNATDPALDALNARHFLDEVANEMMDNDVRRVVELQSKGDVIEYQKQKVSEHVAEESVKQAEATRKVTEADQNLREKVREQEQAKTDRVESKVDDGTAAEPEVPMSDADGVQRLMERNSDFRKFRGKMERNLERKIKRLFNMGEAKSGTRAYRKLADEIKQLTDEINVVDTAVNHYERVFKSMTPDDIGKDWKDTLGTVLRDTKAHTLDPDWWVHRGEYLWSKSFQKFKDGFDHFIARYVSNFLGGDVGKMQRELYDLKRVGKGHFQFLIAQREAGKRVATVQRQVHKMLESFNLSDDDFGRLFQDVAELATSPYLLDDMKDANVNIYHYLSNKLNTEYARYIDMGIPEDVMEAVVEKVREIPQVYAEAKAIAKELGITFGDEVTLGYIPRQKKRSTEFWIDRGHKGENVGADFMKSRKAFHWVPEDSQVVDVVLNSVNPKWKEVMSDALGKPVKHFDELIGDDGAVLSALIGVLDDDTLDLLNDMGVMRKIPFTASESAKFIIDKYELPLKGVSDVFVTDPQRAFEMYYKGLDDRASKNMMTFGLANFPEFTVNRLDMDDSLKDVFTIPFMDALPETMKAGLPNEFTELAKDLMVHPLVAKELKAMFHVTTSAGIMASVGDVLNVMYKAGSSMMLSSGRWLAYQLIGNSANLIKRNMSPDPFFQFAAARIKSLSNEGVMNLDSSRKIYAGGKMTQQEVYELAVKRGLIGSGDTFLGSSAKRPLVGVKDMPKEMKTSVREFVEFMSQSGGHGGVDRTAGQWLTGMLERISSGVDTAIDHTFMRYVDFGNSVTDDAFKFGLLESVLRDPGTRLSIPGWNILGGVPHFGVNDLDDAARYVRENSYMFDEAQGGFESSARYLMPFWSFHRLNIGETARWVAHNPAKFASYFRLYNSLQSGFNEEDSAAWESVQNNKWFDNQFTVPFKMPARITQSGADEIWTIPSAQVFPSAGAFTAVNDMGTILKAFGLGGWSIPFDVGGEVDKPSLSEHNEFSNKAKVGLQQSASPFLRQVLSLIDEDYLFNYDMSTAYDLNKNYALGMNKKQYAMFSMWLPPVAKLLNALPTKVMGRAPELNPVTGQYTEGVPSMFTGQNPHRTSANMRNFFGDNVVGDFLKNMGLQPMPFDMYVNQEYTMGNLQYQVSEAKSLMFKVRRELEQTAPGDTAKRDRLTQRAQETSLLYVHLQSEYEVYRQWRQINKIPHPKALKHIRKENLKVSDLLPKAERERIYQENWDKYMGYFSY